MSYCRFSSDGFQCDLYCYESDEGFMTHVAANRRRFRIPEIPWEGTAEEREKIMHQRELYSDESLNPRQAIGLPFDGETFVDSTLEEFLERLYMLKQTGYQFPAYVIESVKEEIKALSSISMTESVVSHSSTIPKP